MGQVRLLLDQVLRPQHERWFEYALLVPVALACAVAFSPPGADPDLWGHVQYGRDLLENGLPEYCTYSYAAPGHPWINHENLAEIAMAWTIDRWGPRGLLWGKCLLGLGVLALFAGRHLRSGVSPLVAGMSSLLVALALCPHWMSRPQVFTYLFCALVLALLDRGFGAWRATDDRGPEQGSPEQGSPEQGSPEQGSPAELPPVAWKGLWSTVPLVVLATNAHGGFLAIVCLAGAYLGLRAAEGLWLYGRRALPMAAGCLAVIAAMGGATLLNPYGWNLHFWLYQDLSVPRPEILEWHRPDFTSRDSLPFVGLLLVTAAALAFTRRKRDLVELAVLGLTVWQTCEHLRHLPFFALAFGLWVTPHLNAVWLRGGWSRSTGASPMPGLLRVAFLLTLLVSSVLIGQRWLQRLRQLEVRCDEYPVAALQYLVEHGLQGRMVCTFNWAQYALAAVGPGRGPGNGILIHSDGRLRTCYPQELIDMHFDLILGDAAGMRRRSPNSPPPDGARILEFGRPDLLLLDRGQQPAQQVLQAQPRNWVLLYQDGLAQLWGRATRYDVPGSPDYIPPDERLVHDRFPQGITPWPAFPPPRTSSELSREPS